MALRIAHGTEDPVLRQITEAFAKSNRLMAEDLYRESGFMLPQSRNTHIFLKSLLEQQQSPDFPAELVQSLLASLPCNEPEPVK